MSVKDYGLGDILAAAIKVTTGKKPCGPCSFKKETLNQEGRRNFLKGVALTIALAKSTALEAAWKASGQQLTLHQAYALGLVRTLNNIGLALSKNNSGYAGSTLEAVLVDLRVHQAHMPPGSAAFEWASRLDFEGDEIIPGWKLEYAFDSDGYTIVLMSGNLAIITDEVGTIYLSNEKVSGYTGAAADYPGATVFNDFVTKESTNRFKALLLPAAFRAPSGTQCICNAYCTYPNPPLGSNCKAIQCLTECCSGYHCFVTPPCRHPNCYFNVGAAAPCVWASVVCTNCACAHNIFATCCNPCTG